MKRAEDREALYQRMCEDMKNDRAKHNILPLTKFGLMQITRQRIRPAQEVDVEEVCPTCHGQGKIKSSLLFTKVLDGKIGFLVNKLGVSRFTLHVHPYVDAYIKQGLWSLYRKWQMKYGFGVKVIPSQKLALLQYEFYDANGAEIDLKEEIEIR
jgi:ribonuclease G